MGEYAIRKSDGKNVKIGTCEDMYYIRLEDRDQVQCDDTYEGCRFRLPFSDEDDVRIGEYELFDRGIKLYKVEYTPSRRYPDRMDSKLIPFAPTHDGQTQTIQLRHPSGLLVNVTCYHGAKLPEDGPDTRFFFNGKEPVDYELSSIKLQEGRAWACYRCRWCQAMWRTDISTILEYIPDEVLRDRIQKYTEAHI